MNLKRLAGLALAVAFTAQASAQSYYRRDLMDYDQKRNALPNDGKMHCVPTSYVDILRFMAFAGFSGLDKGYDVGYNSITNFINHMGQLMDTDPDTDGGGTNFDDGVEICAEWISTHSHQFFVHTIYGPTSHWGTQRLRHTMAMGYMARIGYSRYYKDGNEWVRDGGHALALAGYDYRTSDKKILVANPATDDGNINAQGSFVIDAQPVVNVSINTDDHGNESHARWSKYKKNGKNWQAIIDRMHVIQPLWAGWVNSQKSTGSILFASLTPYLPATTIFHAEFPIALEDGKNATIKSRDIDLPGPVKDWCMDPGQAAIFVLGEDGSILHVDLLDKEITRVGSVKGGRKLAVAGKAFELFVLKDGDKEDSLLRLDPETGQELSSMKLAKGVTSIEPDQETRGIAALHPASKRLFRVDADLRASKPEAVELPEGTGEVLLNASAKGNFTFARVGGATFHRLKIGSAARRMAVAQKPSLRAIHAINDGLFLIQDGDRIKAVDASGKATSSPFDNIRAAGVVKFARGWKSNTREEFSGKQWRETPPTPEENGN